VGAFGNEREGFSMVGLIYGAVTFLSFLAVFLFTKERYVTPHEARYGLKEMAGLIVKNRPFIICVLIALVAYVVLTMTGTMVNYFMKYNLQNEGLVPLAFICIFGVGTVSVPLWIVFSKKFGKKAMFAAGLALYGMMFLVLFFVHGTSMSVILPVFILAGIGFAGVNIGLWSLIPDTVEYAQWKLGARTEGIQFGIYIFIVKFASSLGAVAVGKVMAGAGYVANAPQTDSSLLAIRLLISIVPFALMALAFVILMFYPITERMHKMMCAEIEARR
jgi:Na+/melibiose symporter-like transporter